MDGMPAGAEHADNSAGAAGRLPYHSRKALDLEQSLDCRGGSLV